MGIRSLRGILESAGVDLEGYQPLVITAISADGGIVAGTARNPDGQVEAFMAVVPEPGSALLLGLGLAALAGSRRTSSVTRRPPQRA